MQSKESQSVELGASQGAMGSLDSGVQPVAGSSNADTENLKIAMETASLERSDFAVGADLKAAVNPLGLSNHRDFGMGEMPLANNQLEELLEVLESSAIVENFKIAIASECLQDEVEPRQNPSDTEPIKRPEEEPRPCNFMDPELYRAATTGDVDAFAKAIGDAEQMLIEKVTPRGNSVLHLAASFGHDKIVNFILDKCPDLVEHKNHEGDLALHVAASAGHLTVVKFLVSFAQYSASSPKTVGANLLWKINQQGDTALHVALERGQHETARFLVQADPKVAYCLNRKGDSPFLMATKSGYLEIVKHIPPQYQSRLEEKIARLERYEEGCRLLHAAIIGRNKDVMDRVWSIDSSLIYKFDEEGRSPLGLAASIGFFDGVCYILGKSADSAYVRDRHGFFPIHWACTRGNIEIIDAFLRRCPDSAELLSEQGENILHIAAKNGRAKLVGWMLKLSKLEMLINEKDEKGFTPLHWATHNCHPKVVSTLTWDKRAKLEIMNNEGLTALDIAEEKIDSNAPFRGRLTRAALKSANAPRSEKAKTGREIKMAGGKYKSEEGLDLGRVNTVILVATLVATVTFACGFTLPGGTNDSDDPNSGMATMVTKGAFQAFLTCNTTALCSSLLAAVTLIWAQLGDVNLIINALSIAVPLLGLALMAMFSAFIFGVYLVVSNHRWLAILVLIMGWVSVAILSIVFFTLCFPLSSKRKIVRYLMYYPIELMILITMSDIEIVIKGQLIIWPSAKSETLQ